MRVTCDLWPIITGSFFGNCLLHPRQLVKWPNCPIYFFFIIPHHSYSDHYHYCTVTTILIWKAIASCISTIASCTPSLIMTKIFLVEYTKGKKWFNEWVVIVGFSVSEGGRGCCNEISLAAFIGKLFSFCLV